MNGLDSTLAAALAELQANGLHRSLRQIDSPQGPVVQLNGQPLLNFSSNDYLGLDNDPLLVQAATDALQRWGLGAGASRLVCGNLAPYRDLEQRLAQFKQHPAALVFGSGYAANVGTITALVGAGDILILDKLDHASIIDGARQSGATLRVYPHKDLNKLESHLQWARATAPQARVLVITETVFSMDGDRAPLAEIVALKQKYGAWLMIDEAHATGVLGPNRRGLAELLGLEDQIEIVLGTLSKALGCYGGYVCGSATLIEYLRNRARSLIYSTALPPALCAAATAAVEFVMSPAGAARCQQLWDNLRAFDPNAASPILPLIIGDERAAVTRAQQLLEQGILVPAIRYPTVAKGKARLRVTLSAAHTPAQIQRLRAAVL